VPGARLETGEIREHYVRMIGGAPIGIPYSGTQRQRLAELDVQGNLVEGEFESREERDRSFEEVQRLFTCDNLERLDDLREHGRPALRRVGQAIADLLVAQGFVEVTTPIKIGRGSLLKMGLHEQHPLWRQIFWLDNARCLRPMLAPNLYFLLSHLTRIWPRPVRLFEIGPCFRDESEGARHLSEFTMVNLVELGPEASEEARLRELGENVMSALGLDYRIESAASEIYGASQDIVTTDGLEVASGVAGPHFLDEAWGIDEPWVGWGFGVERLAMAAADSRQIHRFGRSLIYQDGARLNIQRSAHQNVRKRD